MAAAKKGAELMSFALGLPKKSSNTGGDSGGSEGDLDMGAESKKSAARALRAALQGSDDDALLRAFKRMSEECKRAPSTDAPDETETEDADEGDDEDEY